MGCGHSKSTQVAIAPRSSAPVVETAVKPAKAAAAAPAPAPAKQAPAKPAPAAPAKPAPAPPAKVAAGAPAAGPSGTALRGVPGAAEDRKAPIHASPRFIPVEADPTVYGTKLFAGEVADKVALPRAPWACLPLLCRCLSYRLSLCSSLPSTASRPRCSKTTLGRKMMPRLERVRDVSCHSVCAGLCSMRAVLSPSPFLVPAYVRPVRNGRGGLLALF